MEQAEITCGCGVKFKTPFPPIEVTNQVRASLVIATHEKPVTCPHCGAYYLPAIQMVGQILFEFKPVPEEFVRQHGMVETRIIPLVSH
jgi:hypothetical protein